MIDYRVYLVTDEPSRYQGNWLDNVCAAVEGGVTCVQYRDTESGVLVKYERCLALRDALGSRAPIVVNDDPYLAKAVGAAGVHVGQHDMSPYMVREIVGDKCEIGLSITDFEQLAQVDEKNVNCFGIGPIFDARKTKANASPAMGLSELKRITEASLAMPNCAIGGITLDNAELVLAAGAKGLAVVSAFSRSENSYEVAKSFRVLFNDCR